MSIAAQIVVALLALAHLYIMWFEMFAWVRRGPKIFRTFPKELFEPTQPMAANQGLYNGFLAAGLIWSLAISDPVWQANVAVCFLLFVLVAGLYGALTVARKIFVVQAVPAIIGLGLILF